jgi:hypothetical protein
MIDARQLTLFAIQRAARHADRVSVEWTDRALVAFESIVRQWPTLTTEFAKSTAEATGTIEPPPDPRAWGAVIRAAQSRGWIAFYGYARTTNARAHCRPVTVWKSNLYRS